jgi:hypothetical protein
MAPALCVKQARAASSMTTKELRERPKTTRRGGGFDAVWAGEDDAAGPEASHAKTVIKVIKAIGC